MTSAGAAPLLRLPPQPASAGAARAFVQETLSTAGVPQVTVDTAVLLTSELVTNAILHANTDVEVRVLTDSSLTVQVIDLNDQPLVKVNHGSDSIVGRGLELVEALAEDFGCDMRPGEGKIIWFRLGPIEDPAVKEWQVGEPERNHPIVIRLTRVPLNDCLQLREHSNSLLREYALEVLAGRNECHFDATQLHQAEQVRTRLTKGVNESTLNESPGNDSMFDAEIDIDVNDLPSMLLLGEIFEDAERLARKNVLLTRPAPPRLLALRAWAMREGVRQIEGEDPSPWSEMALL